MFDRNRKLRFPGIVVPRKLVTAAGAGLPIEDLFDIVTTDDATYRADEYAPAGTVASMVRDRVPEYVRNEGADRLATERDRDRHEGAGQ